MLSVSERIVNALREVDRADAELRRLRDTAAPLAQDVDPGGCSSPRSCSCRLLLLASVDLCAATTQFSRIGTLTPPTTSTQ